jgi:glycogen phosphorylase
MFKQSIVNGWQKETADNWLRDGDPWEIARAHEKVEVKLHSCFVMRAGISKSFGPAIDPDRHTL